MTDASVPGLPPSGTRLPVRVSPNVLARCSPSGNAGVTATAPIANVKAAKSATPSTLTSNAPSAQGSPRARDVVSLSFTHRPERLDITKPATIAPFGPADDNKVMLTFSARSRSLSTAASAPPFQQTGLSVSETGASAIDQSSADGAPTAKTTSTTTSSAAAAVPESCQPGSTTVASNDIIPNSEHAEPNLSPKKQKLTQSNQSCVEGLRLVGVRKPQSKSQARDYLLVYTGDAWYLEPVTEWITSIKQVQQGPHETFPPPNIPAAYRPPSKEADPDIWQQSAFVAKPRRSDQAPIADERPPSPPFTPAKVSSSGGSTPNATPPRHPPVGGKSTFNAPVPSIKRKLVSGRATGNNNHSQSSPPRRGTGGKSVAVRPRGGRSNNPPSDSDSGSGSSSSSGSSEDGSSDSEDSVEYTDSSNPDSE